MEILDARATEAACPTRSWQTPSGKLWMEGGRGSWMPPPGSSCPCPKEEISW